MVQTKSFGEGIVATGDNEEVPVEAPMAEDAGAWPTEPNKFPNMYRETTAMTGASIMIFILADLRRMARAGHFDTPQPQQQEAAPTDPDEATVDGDMKTTADTSLGENILTLPINFIRDVRPIWNKHKDGILKRKMKRIEYDTFRYLEEVFVRRPRLEKEMEGAECHGLGDERASKECVYGLFVNPVRKTITLVFRGSITLQDWFQDGKTPLTDIENPLHRAKNMKSKMLSNQPEKIPLHFGFREYLYTKEEKPLMSSIWKKIHLRELLTKSTERSPSEDPTASATDQENVASPSSTESLLSTIWNKMTYNNSAETTTTPATTETEELSPPAPDTSTEGAMPETPPTVVTLKEETQESAPTLEPIGEAEEQETSDPHKNKIEVVMDQIEELYQTRPDYKLYITGHSLGGALALIAALEAATRFSVEQNKPPTTCITLGNPKAGGVEFRNAIYALESLEKLRVLCVHNANDLVPLLPNSFCFSNIYWQKYVHVGMQLRMLDESGRLFRGQDTDAQFSFRYRGVSADRDTKGARKNRTRERLRRFSAIAPCLHRIPERHFYGSYLDALELRQPALTSLQLNDIYQTMVAASMTRKSFFRSRR